MSNVSDILGYTQHGAKWDEWASGAGHWDPTTQTGITNWQNWASGASDSEWDDYSKRVGRDVGTLKGYINDLSVNEPDPVIDDTTQNTGGLLSQVTVPQPTYQAQQQSSQQPPQKIQNAQQGMPNPEQYKPQREDYTATKVDTANLPDFKPVSTVEDRLNNLLRQDNPYIQMARNAGLQHANARGLLNSSVAAGASQKAAIESAVPIASQDASEANAFEKNKQAFTYNAALQDANAENQLNQGFLQGDYSLANTAFQGGIESSLLSQKHGYDLENLNAEQGYILERMSMEHGFDMQKMGLQQDFTLEELQAKQGMTLEQMGLDHQYTMSQLDKNHEYSIDELYYQGEINKEIAQVEGSIDKEIRQLGYDSDTRNQIITSTGKIHQQYLTDKVTILTSDLEVDTKEVLLEGLTMDYQTAINNELVLSGFDYETFETFTEEETPSETPEETEPSGMLTGGDYGVGGR